MVTREEILMAQGAELDALGAKINPSLCRSTVYATDFDGNGSCSYWTPKSDDSYRAELLEAFDSMIGGGPAFGEFKQAGECSIKTGGLTVRDYFAAKAMQGMLANGDWVTNMTNATGKQADEVVGIAAYEVADAMLRERAK